ncbi:alpha/beta-hydrolase [Pleomassaria siparia CBS 279.74]|uniref:Alpha/beta-hydrolase n=1 Tax=Pleomassaria siparia CBS 279.74 TaxID=1314801 RepID=A0A6G1K2C1_9PLEO|nr:alpha/beta-hydrolase [Pleomassaria siparia CBS 279.74]
MFQLSSIVMLVLAFIGSAFAQFSPPVTYDTVLTSPINPNITISYKSPKPGTCYTAFATQKQYSGYVNLPPFTLAPYQQNYSINTFFWFFEARTNPETAPLTIWLNGGPGSSSMIGLFRETGPCEVVQSTDGSYGTQPNMWGWDRSSNILFIDQPTQTGFSFDDAVNGSLYLNNDTVITPPKPLPQGIPSWAFLNGTFSSGHSYSTQNTSVIAASASWHFLQGFLSAFPKYNPGTQPHSNTTEPTGVNLFTESYGGLYGPAFADFFESQNVKRNAGDIPRNSTLEIKLSSVGIINGLVDQLIQAPTIPKFAFNNTYDIQAIDQVTQLNALSDFSTPGGCKDLIAQCRNSMHAKDPQGEGDDISTNKICSQAADTCNDSLNTYTDASSDRSVYDIRVMNPSSFPNYAYLEYLSNADVLRSIGAKVNYTESNTDVWDAFALTGDVIRGTQLTSLANLLILGVRVAFIYGDADVICNWYGGELVSLELARQLSAYNTTFPEAGYADIVTNNSYVGGQVRQYGNLSFSRIYDAGHTVPAYQGETAFTVFTRIIEGNDIGMGNKIDISSFATKGSRYSTYRNKVPAQPKSTCWVRALQNTCSPDEVNQITNGKGVVKNGVWVAKDSDLYPSENHSLVGKPGSLPTNLPTVGNPTTTSVIPLTGVFTATGTPTPTSGASPRFLYRVQARKLFPNWLTKEAPSTKTGRIQRRNVRLDSLHTHVAPCHDIRSSQNCYYDTELGHTTNDIPYTSADRIGSRAVFPDALLTHEDPANIVLPSQVYYDTEPEDEETKRQSRKSRKVTVGTAVAICGLIVL